MSPLDIVIEETEVLDHNAEVVKHCSHLSGVTWVPTRTAAGWGTGARTRAWGVALHLWEVNNVH